MNMEGLRKPAFFAYQFLGQLYDDEIPLDAPRVIATKNGSNVRVLLWDYSPPKADTPNIPFYTRDIPASQRQNAVLSFAGMHEGTYTVSRVGTGWHRNDVYDAYLALGKPAGSGAHLPADMLAKLQAASSGDAQWLPDVVVPSTGIAEIQLPMRTNDVWLMNMEKK
jgi:xylan 1,4-beta-xylosidase